MIRMAIKNLVEKYIEKAQGVFRQIQDIKDLSDGTVREVLDCAERYFKDAVYYGSCGRYEIALASIAYCEGMLDAVRLMKLVEFQWAQ